MKLPRTFSNKGSLSCPRMQVQLNNPFLSFPCLHSAPTQTSRVPALQSAALHACINFDLKLPQTDLDKQGYLAPTQTSRGSALQSAALPACINLDLKLPRTDSDKQGLSPQKRCSARMHRLGLEATSHRLRQEGAQPSKALLCTHAST
eukprot:1158259-Pelagomonas_calceolata.AAC.6